ncbi:IS110 family transposase [Spirosoma agri]|uniref:IS110 family transposase n=1 Tax=Spirosoma agri TaxID=1987381 RepID=A0A6M0IQ33_9BACT|nr:IS110 family transposase [Spirosoma agri]
MPSGSLNMPARAAPYRFQDQIRLWELPRAVVQQLAMFSAARQRLIAVYSQLAGPLAEQQGFINPTFQKQLLKGCQASLVAIEKDRKAVDKDIDQLVEGDNQLKELFGLITSIPGIGPATATEVVIATNEMQTITDPKKMAASAIRLPCWCCPLRLQVWHQCTG